MNKGGTKAYTHAGLLAILHAVYSLSTRHTIALLPILPLSCVDRIRIALTHSNSLHTLSLTHSLTHSLTSLTYRYRS